ncbi:protein of unknown function [Saccharopolyspora kobensis]|uniref:DUF1963 domain-containing protein n=1 Tax=Saccharopolyspora kobensis TaxID=146035 RepID=A0A1H6DCS1_9PSEU|nr:DUF1963 domain-containing protein [Saccharopolyspora kobensis]SEG83121.1 protein of unknown function [Saccharopolyspora kobensis]SFE28608.1 protein of unknown function [Saccharopolyspora kobensis]
MDREYQAAVIREACVEFVGEHLGPQLAALARPGFELRPADESHPAGSSRMGGPALLEPGTTWPHDADGVPLVLFAVLDTDELAPWLQDELPIRPGLLNFFGLEYSDCCEVVPADPERAVEVEPPGASFASVPLHAEPRLALPDVWWGASLEDLIEGFGLDPGPDLTSICDPEEQVIDLFTGEHLGDEYPAGGVDQAFGWPLSVQPGDPLPDRRGEYAHLLRLSSNIGGWEFPEGGSLHFLIPRQALREGDFSEVLVAFDDG